MVVTVQVEEVVEVTMQVEVCVRWAGGPKEVVKVWWKVPTKKDQHCHYHCQGKVGKKRLVKSFCHSFGSKDPHKGVKE